MPIDARLREQAATHQMFDPLYPANKLNPQVPAPIAQILHQALALDPNHRPHSASAMRKMLRHEAQQEARGHQQAEEARRRAEQEKFRRDAETARQQAQQERRRREQAEQQAAAARQQAQQERRLRQQATQTSTPSQLTSLSSPLVFGLMGLLLLAIIAGAVMGDWLGADTGAQVAQMEGQVADLQSQVSDLESQLEEANAAVAKAEEALAAAESSASDAPAAGEGETIAAVRERGNVICGISGSLPGFSIVEDDGSISGMDWDYCRAVAAAVFGDAEAVEGRPSTGVDRFPRLQNGEFDLLSRNSTWTISRDTALGFDLAESFTTADK